jgi:glucosamine-6-phosphate deaminase
VRIAIESDALQVGRRAAVMVARVLRAKPGAVLALPAGATPVGLYEELARLHRDNGLDFSGITCFNLDEYRGLAGDHPASFRSFVQRAFLDHVNVAPGSAHALDGTATDPDAECVRYEELIRSSGGIDLALLGIGADGHIGFNEPGSSLGSRTRVKTLTEETALAGAAGFESPADVPRQALTLGVGTILEARHCLLLATGAAKAEPVRRAIEGPLTAQVTASALQLHPAATAILDEAAANRL